MSITKDQIIEAVASMSVMEVVELIEAMEEKFGVSAAAAVMAGLAAAEAVEEDRVRRSSDCCWRQQSCRHQGRSWRYRSGPERAKGPGRSCSDQSEKKPCPRTKLKL